MPSPLLIVPLAALLAAGANKAKVEPAPAPAPAASPEATPAPTGDQAIQDNGWDEPAPTVAVTPNPGTPPGPTMEEQERLWRLKQHNRFKGLMVSGFTTLGAVYGSCVLVGAIAIDLADNADRTRRRQYGFRMMIPVAGPFAAAPVSRSATLGVLTVAAGLGQVLGLSMGIAGAVKLKEFPNPNKPQFAFAVAPTHDGAQMGLSLRF